MTPNDMAATLTDTAKDMAERAGEKASNLRQSAEQAVESRRQAAADGLASAAEKLHERADKLPGGEKVQGLAHGTANKLEATADYLREHDTQAMVDGVMQFVRRNPGKSLAVAAVVGYMAARAMRED
jgi:ElaB/YqjD/DUF883 family membrane-anchored ribosome-binding protein